MKKKFILFGIIAVTTTVLLSLNLNKAKADGIFCTRGSTGVCSKNVGSIGYSCVSTCGTKDCDGTYNPPGWEMP